MYKQPSSGCRTRYPNPVKVSNIYKHRQCTVIKLLSGCATLAGQKKTPSPEFRLFAQLLCIWMHHWCLLVLRCPQASTINGFAWCLHIMITCSCIDVSTQISYWRCHVAWHMTCCVWTATQCRTAKCNLLTWCKWTACVSSKLGRWASFGTKERVFEGLWLSFVDREWWSASLLFCRWRVQDACGS